MSPKILYLLAVCLILPGCKSQATQQAGGQELFRGGQVACGSFQVYLLTNDKTGYVHISADVPSIDWQQFNSFDLRTDDRLVVVLSRFDADVSEILCNDVMPAVRPRILTRVEARQGTVTVDISKENLELLRQGEVYYLDIKLKEVGFDDSQEPFSRELEGVRVGWLPG